jgi:adenylylsulfate kinase-like enzyme
VSKINGPLQIETLKKRDIKGLYAAADKSLINDLIGYSEPNNTEIVIETNATVKIDESKKRIFNYLEEKIYIKLREQE